MCITWTNILFPCTGNQDSSAKYSLSGFHCNKAIWKSQEFWPHFSRSAAGFPFYLWNSKKWRLAYHHLKGFFFLPKNIWQQKLNIQWLNRNFINIFIKLQGLCLDYWKLLKTIKNIVTQRMLQNISVLKMVLWGIR